MFLTSFDFCLRSATIGKDVFTNEFLVFLVPKEGFGKMINLHDKLYRQVLSKYLRSDILFTPHITVGHFSDEIICQEKINELNKNYFEITGQITSRDIVNYQDKKVTPLEKIKLHAD